MYDVNVVVWERPDTGEICITFRQKHSGKIWMARPVDLVFEEYELGHIYEPTISLHPLWAFQFMKALAEGLDGAGIRTDKDAKHEGLLEATKYHLEDLRRMLTKLGKL